MKSLITTLAVLAFATPYLASAAETTTSTTHKKRAKNPEAIAEQVKMKGEERFKTLDTNHDGWLTFDEFKAGRLGQRDPAKAEEVFNRMDAKHNGKVTMDEFNARVEEKKAERTGKK